MDKSLREISAIDKKSVRFYCCGPTVYGPAHIGNFRTFVLQDIFRRTVELSGQKTKHVRNITDVDDKTIRESQASGQSLTDFTKKWAHQFHIDCQKLNLLIPDIEPLATEHIPEQINMIQTLIDKGLAYQSKDGSVYFDVSEFKDYGRLSKINSRELKEGASKGLNDSDEYGKDSLSDFALWKSIKAEDGDNFWESPWGQGRPGWHIECSAMIKKHLGDDFDLHSGGVDLIFPHHENEIAQSCGSSGKPFANHWFHITHLMVDGGKMSKSLGNLYTISDLEGRGYHPMIVKYSLIMGHYKQTLNFTFDSLNAAKIGLDRLAKLKSELIGLAGSLPACDRYKDFVKEGPVNLGFFNKAWCSLLEDLNTAKALGALFSAVKELESGIRGKTLGSKEAGKHLKGLLFISEALGIKIPTIEEQHVQIPSKIKELAKQRWQAKMNKNWKEADRLRKELESSGWQIKDLKDNFEILPL